MFAQLSTDVIPLLDEAWDYFAPFYAELADRPVDTEHVADWLGDWTRINDVVNEIYARLQINKNLNTEDAQAEARYIAFLDKVFPQFQAAEQKLKQKLLDSGLEPEGMSVPLRRLRTEAELFREANLPLLSLERKLAAGYDRIIGSQAITWDDAERTLTQLRPVYYEGDRERAERAWKLAARRQLDDREALNGVWRQLMDLRKQLAANADLPDFRAYRWKQMLRLDYAPADCEQFQQAVEEVAVPAATRIYEKYRRRLGLAALRPWDVDLDLYTIESPALPSYGTEDNLQDRTSAIFHSLDPQLGEYFDELRERGLLALDNHKGKAPGAYCMFLPAMRKPFLSMNAAGLFADVRTLFHESGHAFHNFETSALPYAQQRRPGLEFSEVASMAMELLAMPYLPVETGGFYSTEDTRRARAAHLERNLLFWPYMAVVDAFQHWVYTHHYEASDPAACDEQWLELWRRFIPGQDWSGLEEEAKTGWHRKQHIFRYPFYYIEYGLAQMGATQVWARARENQAAALANYRRALAMGGTRTLPEVYRAAGAKFAFDVGTFGEAVRLTEQVLAGLEQH